MFEFQLNRDLPIFLLTVIQPPVIYKCLFKNKICFLRNKAMCFNISSKSIIFRAKCVDDLFQHCFSLPSGLMVSALDPLSSGLGSSPGREGAVLLGKTLYSHSASLHPGVQMGTNEFTARGNPVMD